MKKVLITGAAGGVGINTINFLLDTNKYEITALDLKNKKTLKRLKKYKRRINIIEGDVNDSVLIDNLVRDHDIVIHLSTVMPPLSDYRKDLSELIEYNGTENIIRAINYFNPKCTLIYASTTSIYGEAEDCTVDTKINTKNISSYSLAKLRTEELIKKNLSNYVILRYPLILSNIKKEPFMFNVDKLKMIECLTNKDAASCLANSLDYLKKLNKKTFNVGGGQRYRVLFDDILYNVLKNYGFTFKYFLSRVFLEKNYYSPITLDSDELDNIIHYRNDTLQNYYGRLNRRGSKRIISRFIGRIAIIIRRKR